MGSQINERRRFDRFTLEGSLLFSDNTNIIGMAQVMDISQGGVRCVSISPVSCTIGMLNNIELFGSEDNLELTDLSGRMTRCSDNLLNAASDAGIGYYEFGFEFFPRHYPQIDRLQTFLSNHRVSSA
ncbi:MAG: PilZ domain-containing protein [Desulfocapsaceae bacterium]